MSFGLADCFHWRWSCSTFFGSLARMARVRLPKEDLQQLDLILLGDPLNRVEFLPPQCQCRYWPSIMCVYLHWHSQRSHPVTLWLDGGGLFVANWLVWMLPRAMLDWIESLPPWGSWCGHQILYWFEQNFVIISILN